eukprot:9092855-Pyramimonas_sp.AAC.2
MSSDLREILGCFATTSTAGEGIATKIEIYVGTLQPGETDYRQCRMKRLGYLSFDANEKSAFKARELKSVHVNTAAHLMKL